MGEGKSATADALAMLGRRDYTRAALARKLASKGHASGDIDAACRRCEEWGYLDDHAYGRARLRARLQRRPAGRNDGLRDLQRQGLTERMSEAVVDEVFDEVGGERAVLDDAFHRWVARHGEPRDLASAKRCYDHLLRRSFPRYLVLQRLSPWLDDVTR